MTQIQTYANEKLELRERKQVLGKIEEFTAMVVEQNKIRTDQIKRGGDEFATPWTGSAEVTEKQSMKDIMSMLWYRGNAPQCNKYLEVDHL